MEKDFLKIIKAYCEKIKIETSVPVIIAPSEVDSERFHITLSLLPHPVVVRNGRVRFRIRAMVTAEIPASAVAINDCLLKSVSLAHFFDDAQGFTIDEGLKFYGMAYHTPLREDDDLFSDLASEERAYSYNESWLVELEFDLEKIKE